MQCKFYLLLITTLFLLSFTSSATWIVGEVGNATDGTDANGYIVTLWNTTAGVSDNRTDIIGEAGASATSNYYMVDCELLATPCVDGDNISVQVFDNGNKYITNYTTIVVSGAITYSAYVELMENITTTSTPEVSLGSGGGRFNEEDKEIITTDDKKDVFTTGLFVIFVFLIVILLYEALK